MKKDLVSVTDLTPEEIGKVIDTAIIMKKELKEGRQSKPMQDRTLAMVFEKPSLRTRVTFETGMTQLGGHAINLEMVLGKRESTPDIARNLCRWVDVIMARTFAHKSVMELAENSTVPVINGLSDLEHPCQALADFQTILEHKKRLKGIKLTYIGDGNNVCNSLLLVAASVGADMTVGCPEGYDPDAGVWKIAMKLAVRSGSKLVIERDPIKAVKDADAIYTDVWTSMGQEAEAERRKRMFPPYQVNRNLVEAAKKDVIVLHCLPAHRGDEITDEVIDGPHSVVLDEAENRLHVQKAIIVTLVENMRKK